MDESISSGLRFIQWIELSTFCTTGARFNQKTDFTYNKIKILYYLSYYSCGGHIFCSNVFTGVGGGGWSGLLLTAVCGS